MNPVEVAQRIAALDWSGVSLQHQLAVSAAVETLSGKAMPMTTYTTLEDIMPADRTELYKVAAERIEREPIAHDGCAIAHAYGTMKAEAEQIKGGLLPLPNVVQLPVRNLNRWTTLFQLDGREWSSSTHFSGPGDAWAWVVETVAAEHGVHEDQVSSLEGDEDRYDGDDLVTVDGLPVYRLRHIVK